MLLETLIGKKCATAPVIKRCTWMDVQLPTSKTKMKYCLKDIRKLKCCLYDDFVNVELISRYIARLKI